MPSLQCQSCGAPVTIAEPIPRDAECGSCKRDLRSCRNCRHYDPSYNNSCRETMADPVEDKLRRNFCEYFYFNRAPYAAGAVSSRADEARAKLESLFGKSSDPSGASKQSPASPGSDPQRSREADARKKLEGLFRKPEPKPGEPEPE